MNSSHRILYVDAYDSFANNIVGLLESQLNVEVTLVRIDNVQVTQDLATFIAAFDAVVVGPGPGHPGIPSDIGFIDRLWRLTDEYILPILGICLGFQSLSLAFGAQIKQMRTPRHGIVSNIMHANFDVFEGVASLEATQYHSLCADIGHTMKRQPLEINEPWSRTSNCPDLQPLAWETSDEANGPVLMSVRHAYKPFWGVQFHPESICTTSEGHRMIQKWWNAARTWSLAHGRITTSHRVLTHQVPSVVDVKNSSEFYESPDIADLKAILNAYLPDNESRLLWATHRLGSLSVVELCDAMGLKDDEAILLDSQGHHSGRFSIVGIVSHGRSLRVTYSVSDKQLRFGAQGKKCTKTQLNSIDEIWPLLQGILVKHAPQTGEAPPESPFWGGWMGYISYEAGLETLNVDTPSLDSSSRPDLNFTFIERSIVLDHQERNVYLQSLLPGDNMWLLETGKLIDNLSGVFTYKSSIDEDDDINRIYRLVKEMQQEDENFKTVMECSYIDRPKKNAYCKKVLECQKNLAAGDSYELCLTDETRVYIPRIKDISLSPWVIYKKLRKSNPAPFGCYIRLKNATIVGSSPERFLKWTREGHCQFRPIKGTVKKSPGVDFRAASAILNTSKERAENLMIVDLIRHDLSGVVGASNCTVPKLMQVEEYETVFQLVSVIEGQIPNRTRQKNRATGSDQEKATSVRGIDVLKASLPPGSMTGAPKKRSCEILRGLEQRPRGIYSGVIGYMDVGGGGDFSVVIRTATRWDEDVLFKPAKCAFPELAGGLADGQLKATERQRIIPHDVWRVGAGGAITVQSTDLGEFNEMETKLDSVLKAFLV